jgi:hypothetical protein
MPASLASRGFRYLLANENCGMGDSLHRHKSLQFNTGGLIEAACANGLARELLVFSGAELADSSEPASEQMDAHPSRSKLGQRPLELSSIGCCDLGLRFMDSDEPYTSLFSEV